MKHNVGNTFFALDVKSTYYGIVLDGQTWRNVLNTVTCSKSDLRGALIVPQSKTKGFEAPVNVCKFLTRQASIQDSKILPTLFSTVEVAVEYPLDE